MSDLVSDDSLCPCLSVDPITLSVAKGSHVDLEWTVKVLGMQ